MRALFIQHDHVSPVGHVGGQFRVRGYDVTEQLVVPESRFLEPGVAATFPEPTDYDVVVPMGAPWSVYDEATIGAWVLEELTFLRRAHEAGVPILGICFGGQALASALGGSVVRAAETEVGWRRVSTEDPELIEEGPWFEWHHDRWVVCPVRRLAQGQRARDGDRIGRTGRRRRQYRGDRPRNDRSQGRRHAKRCIQPHP